MPAGSVKSLAEVTAALDLKVTRMLNITPEFDNEGPISVRLSICPTVCESSRCGGDLSNRSLLRHSCRLFETGQFLGQGGKCVTNKNKIKRNLANMKYQQMERNP